MPVIAGLALAVSTALTPVVPEAATASVQATVPASHSVEEYVREYFADIPVMAEIAKCESRFRQFGKDGKVIKNPGSSAVGVFQIMSSIHSAKAKELGLDINSLQGNAAFARYLYDQHKKVYGDGTLPWKADLASKNCWGGSEHIAAN